MQNISVKIRFRGEVGHGRVEARHTLIVQRLTNGVCASDYIKKYITQRMRSEGYGNLPWPVCLCVAVYDYSRTTGNETDYERYRRLQCNKRLKNKMPKGETGIADVAWPHACVYVHARERSHHHHSLELYI